MTLFAQAMRDAGVDTNGARLHTLAVDCLRDNDVNPRLAINPFNAEIRAASGILISLMGDRLSYSAVRDRAYAYLETVAADMRPKQVPAQAGGGVQRRPDSRKITGPAKFSEGTGGHSVIDSRVPGVPRPSDPVCNASGQRVSESHLDRVPRVAKPIDDSVVIIEDDSQQKSVRAVVDPHDSGVGRHVSESLSQPVRPAVASLAHPRRSLAGAERQRALFDTLKIRDGQSIGDVRWSSLPRLRGENAREAALIDQLLKHATPGDPNARVRDVVSEETLRNMIQKSAEIDDAQR